MEIRDYIASQITPEGIDELQRLTLAYILGYNVRNIRPGINEINIELKYVDGTPVIQEIKRVSKPGRRVYSRADRLPKFYNGLGISVLTTAKGILSDREARSQSLGGEIMCTVF